MGLFVSLAPAWGQGVWERRADVPIPLTEGSAAAIVGKVYLVCGLSAQGSTGALQIYDPKLDQWTQGAPVPIAGGGDHCNVAAAGGKLYVLGAIRVGSPFIDGNTYEYDPALDRWQTVGAMNVPRGASGVAAVGSTIYVAGGLAASGSVADFEAFDTAARAWRRLPNMPTARDHLTAQAIGGRVYAISGRSADVLAVNEEFDPAANSWRSRAPIPTPRGGLGSGTIGNRIQVFGGEGPSGTPEGTYRQNEEYDPAANTWRSLAPMPTPRHGLYGATIDGRIFTPAGGPQAGANFSSVNDAFYLPPEQPPQVERVVNAASGEARLAPGAIATVFGARLSSGEQQATRLPLPTQMNAVQVRVNGAPVRLYYVAAGQVNFEMPASAAAGPVSVTVNNAGSDSAAFGLTLAEAAPAIFPAAAGSRQGAILIAGTATLAGPSGEAARRGQAVEIYCTGLGTAPVTVSIGGSQAQVLFSGPAPGFPGLQQVNAIVPAEATAGAEVPVTIQAAGVASNTAVMAVRE